MIFITHFPMLPKLHIFMIFYKSFSFKNIFLLRELMNRWCYRKGITLGGNINEQNELNYQNLFSVHNFLYFVED